MARKPIQVRVKRLADNATIPQYATEQAACFDFIATSRTVEGNTATYGTGLAFEVPEGHALMIYSRSGHGFNSGLRLANAAGVIDADYRGEVKVKLTYDGPSGKFIDWPRVGDRIAQGMIIQSPQVTLIEVDELSETKRGNGGFGSTGK